MRLDFGTHVQFTSVIGRLRRFYEYTRRSDGLEVDRSYLDLGHGRRAHLDQIYGDDKFDGLDVLADPGQTGKRYGHTKVQLVRVPIHVVRDPWTLHHATEVFKPDHTPMQGLVIGETRRQCGIVTTEEHGGQWENRGSIPAITVARRSDHSATIYDVHPDDLEVSP